MKLYSFADYISMPINYKFVGEKTNSKKQYFIFVPKLTLEHPVICDFSMMILNKLKLEFKV